MKIKNKHKSALLVIQKNKAFWAVWDQLLKAYYTKLE